MTDIPNREKRTETNQSLSLQFPAIRGLQANREYYVAMWKIRLLLQFSIFDEDELPPELRAQRSLDTTRIPEISRYILNNPNDYTFSSLTLAINSAIQFDLLPGQDQLGMLSAPLDAKFIISDGQHRRAAIKDAVTKRPELANETIPIVLFVDQSLERSQQMFADLNRHAVRPCRSIGILYEHRNEKAKLARKVILESNFFRDLVEMEKSSLAKRSRKLFTLSAFFNACADLVHGLETGDLENDAQLAREYFETVAEQFPSWAEVRAGTIPASNVRTGFIHSHGITLQALGKAGNSLLRHHNRNWKQKLRAISGVNWSRNNTQLWEGRAMHHGVVQKKNVNVELTANVIRIAYGLPIEGAALRIEESFLEEIKTHVYAEIDKNPRSSSLPDPRDIVARAVIAKKPPPPLEDVLKQARASAKWRTNFAAHIEHPKRTGSEDS